MPTAIVADDYERWRHYISSVLKQIPEMNVTAQVADGMEVVEKAETLRPDLIVLDLGLPHLNGMEALRRIRLRGCHSKMLIMTNEVSDDVVEEAFRSGALGYVVKTDAHELAAAINRVLRGEKFASSHVVHVLNS